MQYTYLTQDGAFMIEMSLDRPLPVRYTGGVAVGGMERRRARAKAGKSNQHVSVVLLTASTSQLVASGLALEPVLADAVQALAKIHAAVRLAQEEKFDDDAKTSTFGRKVRVAKPRGHFKGSDHGSDV